MPSEDSGSIGAVAVDEACSKYNLTVESTAYYDAISSTGKKYESKTTAHTRADGSVGRIRIWRKEHSQLAAAGGWYVVSVYDRESGKILAMRRMQPSTLRSVAPDWYPSGHEDKGEQAKIAWTDLFPDLDR